MNKIAIGISSALIIIFGSLLFTFFDFCDSTTSPPEKFSFTDGVFKTKNVENVESRNYQRFFKVENVEEYVY